MLSYEKLFLMFGIGFGLALPLLLFMRKSQGASGTVETH